MDEEKKLRVEVEFRRSKTKTRRHRAGLSFGYRKKRRIEITEGQYNKLCADNAFDIKLIREIERPIFRNEKDAKLDVKSDDKKTEKPKKVLKVKNKK